MDRHCVIPCLKSQDLVYMILADLQRVIHTLADQLPLRTAFAMSSITTGSRSISWPLPGSVIIEAATPFELALAT
jgi:hypothetical protein